jgi:hypothetical protein
MLSDVAQAASEAGLSPLVVRIALLLADIDGRDRALQFIESCRREDEIRTLHRSGTVDTGVWRRERASIQAA